MWWLMLVACGPPREVRILTDGDGLWELTEFTYAGPELTETAEGGWMHFVSQPGDNWEKRDRGYGEAVFWHPVTIDGTVQLQPVAESFTFHQHDKDRSLAVVWASDRYNDLFFDDISATHVELTSGLEGDWEDGDAVRTWVLDK